MPEQKTCFVVMGFHKKTDYATGRTLDLDKTHDYIIQPAAKAAGLKCVRADEIVHSGVIDVPMYRQLLEADVVVADISTMNPNALYELGVRHALRPSTTIVIGESKIKEKGYPFDLNHLAIRDYQHLGEGIDFGEVVRMRDALAAAMAQIVSEAATDSPVYTYISGLRQPTLAEAMATAKVAAAPATTAPEPESHSALLAHADKAMAKSDFGGACVFLAAANEAKPGDPYLVQRLALARYKSKSPTALEALHAARDLLSTLEPKTANDPETLGLWGAVHKRLFELTGERAALDTAVFAYEKGFYLKNDYYNGINLAFVLSVRATLGEPAEAIADFVCAQRIRQRVADICAPLRVAGPSADSVSRDTFYWVLAALAEALVGDSRHAAVLDEAYALDVAEWMKESTKEQLAKLDQLLADSPLKYLANAGG